MKSPVYLNALRAFEASARHKSFAGAATELHVSPAAVGQLVRTLEEWLGHPLFARSNGGRTRLVPTEAAERALPDLRLGFDRLTLGLERLKEGTSSGVLTVAISPAFAAKWLLPRIDRFQSAWPSTYVRLDTDLKPVDFIAQRIDIGVRYGAGSWPGLMAEKLMDEEVYPVCSPRIWKSIGRTPEDLRRQMLIHDLSMDGREGFPTWEAWLMNAGVKGGDPGRGMQINNSAAVLQAAIESQGVALARSEMARDDLAAGRLVRLFPNVSLVSPLAYYVVYRSECSDLPRLRAFRDWLRAEVAVANGRGGANPSC